jgi:hypothetical protein
MPTPTQSAEADALLKSEVSIPAFFAKVAADTGISPPGGDAANRLLTVGDLVVAASDMCVAKWAAEGHLDSADPVKSATDVAFAAAGLTKPAAAAAPDYAEAPGVKAAAELLAAARATPPVTEAPAAPAEAK